METGIDTLSEVKSIPVRTAIQFNRITATMMIIRAGHLWCFAQSEIFFIQELFGWLIDG
jgi:hypothetical protein